VTVKVGINGFGSIGRRFLRIALKRPDIEVVAVNDLAKPEDLGRLLKYDSNYGTLDLDVSVDGDTIKVGDSQIKMVQEPDPAKLPWDDLGVEVVVESTGRFTARQDAIKHVESAGARRVVISAPAKGPDLTVVMGVNHQQYEAGSHQVVSNASCTTNCLAPIAKVLNDEFSIVKGLMTTIHAYTLGQSLLDFPTKDPRRSRAAALSIIPTTTGAARAVTQVLPELEGKLNGMAMRVPTPTVSIVDLVVEVNKTITEEEVNAAMKKASEGPMKGILGYSAEPLVSVDYKGSSYSSVFDALSTMVIADNMVKVLSWYDNEWGYATRLVDLVEHMASKGL